MNVLKGILSESKEYYLNLKKKVEHRILLLPNGSIKRRMISGKQYYYIQQRKGNKIIHSYLGKAQPAELMKKIREKQLLLKELKKINQALRLLKKIPSRQT